MITEMQLYWLLKLDDIRIFFEFTNIYFSIVGGVSLFLYFVVSIFRHIEPYNTNLKNAYKKGCNNIIKFIFPIMLIHMAFCGLSLGIMRFLPSTKQMAIIYVVPKVVNNKEVQAIPKKLLKLSNDWLDEITPEKLKKEKVELKEEVKR